MTDPASPGPRGNPYESPRSPIGSAPGLDLPRTGVWPCFRAIAVGSAVVVGLSVALIYASAWFQVVPAWPISSLVDLAVLGIGMLAGGRSLRGALAHRAATER